MNNQSIQPPWVRQPQGTPGVQPVTAHGNNFGGRMKKVRCPKCGEMGEYHVISGVIKYDVEIWHDVKRKKVKGLGGLPAHELSCGSVCELRQNLSLKEAQ